MKAVASEVIQKTRRKRRNRKSQTRREAAAVGAEAVGAAAVAGAEASDARCLVDNIFLIYYILDCDVVPAPDTNHKVDHHERAVHHTASDDVQHPIHTAVDDHSTMQYNAMQCSPTLGSSFERTRTMDTRTTLRSSIVDPDIDPLSVVVPDFDFVWFGISNWNSLHWIPAQSSSSSSSTMQENSSLLALLWTDSSQAELSGRL
jgi:hypothetical protein